MGRRLSGGCRQDVIVKGKGEARNIDNHARHGYDGKNKIGHITVHQLERSVVMVL